MRKMIVGPQNKPRISGTNRLIDGFVRAGFLLILISLAGQINVLGQTLESESASEIACGLVDAELVNIRIVVEDMFGRSVSKLKYDEFIIYENGLKQTVEYLAREQGTDKVGRRYSVYHISYYSTDALPDGTVRLIRVDVKDGQKRKLKGWSWPASYIAKKVGE